MTNNIREVEIRNAVNAALAPVLRHDHDAAAARETMRDADRKDELGREGALLTLAGLSAKHDWTTDEVDAACVWASTKLSNAALPKAVATFMGDLKCATNKAVRLHFPTLLRVRDTVWQAEVDARKVDKTCAAPATKAFVRKYHFLKRLMNEARQGNVIAYPAEAIAFAKANDPDLDLGKVKRRVDAVFADLAGIAKDFPVEDLEAVVQMHKYITERSLAEARAKVLGVSVNVVLGKPELDAAKPVLKVSEVLDGVKAPEAPVAEAAPVAAPAPKANKGKKAPTFVAKVKPAKTITKITHNNAPVGGVALDATDDMLAA